tara:strand:- start:224 stop:541 length:318 start_codon:yes stop_codon:yes gene_type:complete
MPSRKKKIREWGTVPGRKDHQMYSGGMGTAQMPMIDGVDVDIYMTNIDTTIDGHGSVDNQEYAVEITVQQDPDLEPNIRTFRDEEEALLYARKYIDFLNKVLSNT